MIFNHPDYDGGRTVVCVTPASRRLLIETYRAARMLYPRAVAHGTVLDLAQKTESLELTMADICYRAQFQLFGRV